jgi:predicted methyltransferase
MRKTLSILAMALASVTLISTAPTLAARKKVKAPAAAPLTVLDPATAQLLEASLTGSQRTAEEKARDVYRHPKEVLAFYGLKATQTVIEVSPGAGWWTDVLAPVLRDNGKLIVAMNTDVNSGGRRGLGATLTRFGAAPKVFDKVEIVHYAPSKGLKIGTDGSADMVMVFRHMHGIVGNDVAPQALKLYHDALKPGGTLAIEQHRWPEAKPYPVDDATKKNKMIGYMTESDVIARITAAGFKLVSKSEINANPKDTKDHPNAVWSLPPTLEGGDTDKAKYLAIGESDRMTLKFVKPAM